jgi:tRNA(Arg) A34 adenosine deaminase TadA
MTESDLRFLRQAITVSERSRADGNHPFGAVLVINDEVVLEAANTVRTTRDATGHAETNLLRQASMTIPAALLANATLYSSCEPCAMCAGALYWTGIRRLVYALSEERLYALTGANNENPTMRLPCREVLSRGQRQIEVAGPALEDEAARAHLGFWVEHS